MKKLRNEFKILLTLCFIVTVLGGLHLFFVDAIQSLIVTIVVIPWFIALNTPDHDKYIIPDDTDFRN